MDNRILQSLDIKSGFINKVPFWLCVTQVVLRFLSGLT